MTGSKKRNRYYLAKPAIFALMAMATLGLTLLSASEIEVIPPDFFFSYVITQWPLEAQPFELKQPSDLNKSDTEILHHGEVVDYEGKAKHCLECHEDMIIKSHKILIKYPPPYRGPAVTFRPLEEVQALGMKFEDDMITCISCHDLRNQNKNQLALEPRTSGHAQKLCYVCHLEID